MLYRLAHLAVLVAHVAWIASTVFGLLWVVRRPALRFAHQAALAWGVFISATGWVCPLTDLEAALAARACGEAPEGDFVARGLEWLVYWRLSPAIIAALATITGRSADEAAGFLSDAVDTFHLSATDAGRVVDQLAVGMRTFGR